MNYLEKEQIETNARGMIDVAREQSEILKTHMEDLERFLLDCDKYDLGVLNQMYDQIVIRDVKALNSSKDKILNGYK